MATEAAVSGHSAASERSEKELKKTEPEKVANLEPKEPESAAAESGDKIEDKKTEPLAAEEVEEIKTNEEPKAEEPKSVAATSAESGAKIEGEKSEAPVAEEVEEKKIEPPAAEEVKEIKTDQEPKAEEPESVAAASAESGAKIEEKKTEASVAEEVEEIKADEKPKAEDTAESTAQKFDDKQVESPTIEEVTKTEDSPITEGAKETVLESETTNNSEHSTKCKSEEELPRKVEELPAAEVETIMPNDEKVSKISESIPLVEEKAVDQPEAAELTVKEPIVVDPVKDVEVETVINKVEETIVVEISDRVESEDTPEIRVLVKDVEDSPSGKILEKTTETKVKIIEPNDAETAGKSIIADKSSGECEGDTEKAAESKVISRSIELAPENEKKEETVASSETNIAAEVDDKAEKEATATEAEAKEAEKTPVTETKLEEEKKNNEAVKADAQDSECTRDSEETKTSQDVPKEDVPVKAQKQSNNIIKMMKHSLGKAKKAIIGKPQNSKAPAASETKDESASK